MIIVSTAIPSHTSDFIFSKKSNNNDNNTILSGITGINDCQPRALTINALAFGSGING